MVFSSSAMISLDRNGSANGILFRQIVATTVGALGLLAAVRIDYHVYTKRWLMYSLVALTGRDVGRSSPDTGAAACLAGFVWVRFSFSLRNWPN